jgi:cytochrome c biogenesis protein CcmG/thiol:disulfide interchange protein DsbE
MTLWRRLLVLAPLVIMGALAILFYARLHAGDAARIPSALIGKRVPAFTLPGLPDAGGGQVNAGGGQVTAGAGLADADLRDGKVTLVNVFASWCVPCHQEHPELMALAARGVRIVGIAYKDEPENSRRFLGKDGNPYAHVGIDRAGTTAIDFGVYGVPETFVVRGDGTIIDKIVGPLTPENLANDLMPALAKAGG